MLIIKLLIGGLIIFMLFNLFKAMMLMIKNEPGSPSMTKYIGRRVMTSALIILLILLALATGLITPNPSPY